LPHHLPRQPGPLLARRASEKLSTGSWAGGTRIFLPNHAQGHKTAARGVSCKYHWIVRVIAHAWSGIGPRLRACQAEASAKAGGAAATHGRWGWHWSEGSRAHLRAAPL